LITLNSIPGQQTAKRILLNSFNKQRLASTYLFYGADGSGKWPIAVALTALINCENPVKDEAGVIIDACGVCRNCHQIGNLAFPEFHFALPIPPHKSENEAIDLNREYLEQKRGEPYRIITSTRQLTIPIDIAREIKRKSSIRPASGMKRVILFYQMEKMLPASADSLLKLIEEPPPETIIILTALDPDNLLPTIQSRAQKVLFRPLNDKEIEKYLIEKYGISEEKAALLARLGSGSLGRALNLIDEEGEISLRQNSFFMFKGLFQKENPSILATLNEFVNPNNRGEMQLILSHWHSFLSDIIMLKYGGRDFSIINIDLATELENLTAYVSGPDEFCLILEELKQATLDLRRNAHIRLALAALIFKVRKYMNQSP
jgi:DNA polymerase-3 subunit delta'